MGLLKWLKKTKQNDETTVPSSYNSSQTETITAKQSSEPSSTIIPEHEKQFYQSDEYYTAKPYEGTIFETTVIPFEERKKTCIPSSSGLYVGEILLLSYCEKGKYPCPEYGYQAFWWFEYGIRNVGAVLSDLERRGFLYLLPAKECAQQLTVPKIKELLKDKGYGTSGKKADLITKVSECASDEELIAAGVIRRYALTEKGKKELEENVYVPYMHSNQFKTRENTGDIEFNVWSINRELGNGSKTEWRSVVEAKEKMLQESRMNLHQAFLEREKARDPENYKLIKAQDDQIEVVNKRKEEYRQNRDLAAYIVFWEQLWKNGGLVFEGSAWHFELAELYIKAKRYDDALKFLSYLKKIKPSYSEKADMYIRKVDSLQTAADNSHHEQD